MMRAWLPACSLLSACLLAAVPAVHGAEAGAPGNTALADQAKSSVSAFAAALKSELIAAMQAGGPLQAIDVCHARAPAIAADLSRQQGVQLSRVSQRNRNPVNAPNDWQTDVLQAFEARRAAGEDVAALTWQTVAETAAGEEFRFMKAIPTAALCLGCHGEAIAPPVAEKLAELYPDDRATGFSEGDIRGAFVVTRQLD